MNWRNYLCLSIINVLIIIIVLSIQTVPGYMDAEYYYLGGLQLVEGNGFSEPIIWNYLDDPSGLPHPSHSYWMPLASIISAIGMKIFGLHNFKTARISFAFLAFLIPLLTSKLSYKMFGNKEWAFVSGLIAISYGYYLPYMNTTDTFALYMFLGLVFFLMLLNLAKYQKVSSIALGVIAGLMHLTRSDGILWLLILFLCHLLFKKPGSKKISVIYPILLSITGYLIVMTPWVFRNLMEFGTLLSPGGLKTLWLTSYDQLFIFPSTKLTFQNWWSTGLSEIIKARLWALGINLQRVVAEQGMIFLTPLIIIWMWKSRMDKIVRVGIASWLMTLIGMTLLFPYAGARGGLFHSGAALQPLFWVGAPIGLGYFINWGVDRRRWKAKHASWFFNTAIVAFSFTLSGFFFYQRVIGFEPGEMKWDAPYIHYQNLEEELLKLGASREEIVLVKNPPGYFIGNSRKAIVIPDGDITTILSVADRYWASYVLLEQDHVLGLDNLYQSPINFHTRLHYLGNKGNSLIFEIK